MSSLENINKTSACVAIASLENRIRPKAEALPGFHLRNEISIVYYVIGIMRMPFIHNHIKSS